jgi:hypothetical protein
MVYTSDMIAAQTGAFQQQSMMQMQHAGMISQFAGMRGSASPGSQMAGGLAGSAINTAAAVGAPLMSAGMMMAGLDPFSMGLKGAVGGFGRAGVMGAVGGGLAAAALPMAGLMGAQYVGGQMFTGMQQQQMLNQQLGSSFGHMNSYGGRGFTHGESHNIGTYLREMSGHRGPGGEYASMDEMGRLAANMGRMGMAQGVKDAKDFKEKFTQMMKTVRSIAEDFSTSLEEAQKIMGSMRGAGIFGTGNQKAFGGMMRQTAVGAGVSMDEASQMANVGSQIARSIGGRGRSGAASGLNTLGTVGGAMKAGVLSEEDIYNATGLTGAEGRQAMATNMMQRDASFLKGSRGRQLLAAIAQKDGTVDMEAVRKIQSGEVSVEDTIAMRGDHLNTMSRANFIRNEGRLRGEALQAFGGMASSSAHLGWLRNKGYDPATMDDKAMLAFQKHTGMDRDEADAEIKMLKNMDRIQDVREDSLNEDKVVRGLQKRNETVGISGVKKMFEDARKSVQDKIQQLGSDMLDEATDTVEGAINFLTGEYVRKIETGLSGFQREALQGTGDSNFLKEKLGLSTAIDVEGMSKDLGYKAAVSEGGQFSNVALGDFEFLSESGRAEAVGGIFNRFEASKQKGGIQQLIAMEKDREAYGGREIDAEKVGKYLERDDVLERSTQLVRAMQSGDKDALKAAAKAQADAFKEMEGKEGVSKEDLNAQRQMAAYAAFQAGEGDTFSYTKEELSGVGQAMKTTVGMQDLRQLRSTASRFHDELSSVYKMSDQQLKDLGPMGEHLRKIKSSYTNLVAEDGSKESIEKQRQAALTVMQSMGAMRSDMETASMEDLEKMAATGYRPVAAMASREAREDAALKRGFDSNKAGAGLQATVGLMGLDINLETAAKLKKSGKSGDDLIKALEEETGMVFDEIQGKDRAALKDALSGAMKGGKEGLEAVDKALTGASPAVRKAVEEQTKARQDSGAAESDPSFRKLDSVDKGVQKLIEVTKMVGTMTAGELKSAFAKKEGEGGNT